MITFSLFPKFEDRESARKEARGVGIAFLIVAVFYGGVNLLYYGTHTLAVTASGVLFPVLVAALALALWITKNKIPACGLTAICAFNLYVQVLGMIFDLTVSVVGIVFGVALLGAGIRAIQAARYLSAPENNESQEETLT